MRKVFLLSAALFIAFGLSGCSYNELVEEQQKSKGKWADVESSLQRRADLIPNLVKTAKMTGIQEQEVFGQIAEARSKLLNASKEAPKGADGAKTPEQKAAILAANNSFGGTIGRLLALNEKYPELKSSEAFMKVQDELAGTENRINVARKDYNKAVTDYNITRNQFPAVLTASILGFKEETLFEADEKAKDAPDVGDPNSLRRDSNKTVPPGPDKNTEKK